MDDTGIHSIGRTQMKPFRTFICAAAVLACTMALSACTQDNHDLPSLSAPATPSASTSLETIAQTYYDCMTDAGITVELKQNNQGQLAVVDFVGADTVMWRQPDGDVGNFSTGDITEQDWDDFESISGDGTALMIDGVDYSKQYGQCLAESGYDERTAEGNYEMDPVQIEKQITSNNIWAACARENGWPDIQDSIAPSDTAITPTVVLPLTITDDQLWQLLQACSNVDPAQIEEMQQWRQTDPTGFPDDYLPDPCIDFDVPGMSSPNGPEQADVDRMSHLIDIVNQNRENYYQQQGG